MTSPGPVRVCVLTVSDSCSAGLAEDTSGPLLAQLAREDARLGAQVVDTAVVPDIVEEIRRRLVSWADGGVADIILTTGGTGFAPRDVTPEATLSILDRSAPGLVAAMLTGSLAVTPLAALSRPAAGIRGKTIIVNMPGSKKAVKECYGFIQPALRHAVDLLQERAKPVKATHKELQGSSAQKPQAYVHECPHQKEGGRDADAGDGTLAGRARQSAWPLISVTAAQEEVAREARRLLTWGCGGVACLGAETVHYRGAEGRVLTQDVVARDPLPPFPASTKDGYAVIAADGPGVRRVRGGATAGCDPGMSALTPGEVVRINTGAPVPPGADSVVMVENTRLVRASEDGEEEIEVEILTGVSVGQDIRPIGCDISQGETVLRSSDILGPGELGLLAAVGVTEVSVSRLPVVTVLSTGNEIQEPDTELLPGHVRDSNKTTLMSLLRSVGGIEARDGGIAKDDLATLTSSLGAALEASDLVVTTGGVSMGDRDLLRQVLVDKFGAKVHFARVNMKPGKPTTFATCEVAGRTRLVLGLPGNPVSASVTCHLHVLPCVRLLSGLPQPLPGVLRASLATPGPLRLDPRPEYLRVELSFQRGGAVGVAVPTGNQMSSRQASMSRANGLMLLPARTQERETVDTGFESDVILIGNIYSK